MELIPVETKVLNAKDNEGNLYTHVYTSNGWFCDECDEKSMEVFTDALKSKVICIDCVVWLEEITQSKHLHNLAHIAKLEDELNQSERLYHEVLSRVADAEIELEQVRAKSGAERLR